MKLQVGGHYCKMPDQVENDQIGHDDVIVLPS